MFQTTVHCIILNTVTNILRSFTQELQNTQGSNFSDLASHDHYQWNKPFNVKLLSSDLTPLVSLVFKSVKLGKAQPLRSVNQAFMQEKKSTLFLR